MSAYLQFEGSAYPYGKNIADYGTLLGADFEKKIGHGFRLKQMTDLFGTNYQGQ